MKKTFNIIVVSTLFLLQSCESNNVPATEVVLATVGKEKITQTDLDLSIEKISAVNPSINQAQISDKALESLIMMGAVAQKQQQASTEQELYIINKKTQRYRKELLLEAYLRKHAQPQAPTEQQVKDYYEKNLHRFGAGTIKTYELLKSQQKPKADELQKILQLLAQAKNQFDWQKTKKDMASQGVAIEHIRGKTDGPELHRTLHAKIAQLEAKQTSDVIYVDKKPYLLRVLDVKQKPAKPLREVNQQIRKILAAKKMRDNIKTLAEAVLQETKVEYTNKK